MKTNKIRPLSVLKGNPETDSVKIRHTEIGDKNNAKLLDRAYMAWENMRSMREERERCMRFCYGDQWGDLIETPYKGRIMTERDYIKSQHKVPLTNNLTRRLVSSLKGAYLKQGVEPICVARDPDKSKEAEMLSMALQCNWQMADRNMETLLSSAIEDYAIGGFLFSRESWEVNDGKFDTATYFYNPNYCFFNSTMRDAVLRDMDLCGVIHDVTKADLISRFKIQPAKLKEMLEENRDYYFRGHYMSQHDIDKRNDLNCIDFFSQWEDDLYRIYEIWTRETKQRYLCIDPNAGDMFKCEIDNIDKTPLERYGLTMEQENRRRINEGASFGIPLELIPLVDYGQLSTSNPNTGVFGDQYWYCQYLLPNGDILWEGESPFECGCPFTIALYPMVNGEVHSFVSDVIPQQKNINRLTTLNDIVIRSTAKGVLLVDKRSIPEDSSLEIMKEQWSDPDGLLVYDSKRGGILPKQQNNTSTNVGIDQALATQLKFMEDASGIHGAIQGKDARSGQSASLYAQQANNATTTLLPFFESFKYFTRQVAIKKAKMIQQFYTEYRFVNISGTYYNGVKRYDPDMARNLEWDVSIQETAATDVQRAVNNELLLQLWQAGAINVEALLEVGKFPFSDRLLQYLRNQQQMMQQQQMMGQAPQPEPMPEDLQRQINGSMPDRKSIGDKVMSQLNNANTIALAQ